MKRIGMGLTGACIGTDALAGALQIRWSETPPPGSSDAWIKDYLHKMHNYDAHHPGDRFVSSRDAVVFESVRSRLLRVQRTVGYGNFHLIGFDDALNIARGYARVGAFPRNEIEFLEKIFYREAAEYGFYGAKACRHLTDTPRVEDVVKIPRTGNYLYRGRPLELYRTLRATIGSDAILTSGIRCIVKQFVLFFNKAWESELNLSMASRSLAPPGYSFHGTGDFDVGQVGFGAANFTERFATTDVFRRLTDQGFVNLRYSRDNLLGVRFEPWHIKVAG